MKAAEPLISSSQSSGRCTKFADNSQEIPEMQFSASFWYEACIDLDLRRINSSLSG